jgi:hypothetical protein
VVAVAKQKAEAQAAKKEIAKRDGRGWGLSSLPACRRRLARLLSDIDNGTVDNLPKARTLIYGIAQVIACLKFEKELEIIGRIETLENDLETQRERERDVTPI